MSKRTFELNLANGVKSFWAYVRSKTKTKTTVGPLQDQIGELIDDDESMCNMLNKFFTSVFTKEDLSYIPNAGKRDTYESDPKLEDFLITTSDIHKHFVELKDKKAPAPRILKEVAQEICYPLCIVF